MIHPNPLSRVIAMLLSGTALAGFGSSVANAAAVTSYNTFNHDRSAPNVLVSGGNGTDGWMRTTANSCGAAGSSCGNGPAAMDNPNKVLVGGNAAVPWVGNDPRDTSFNYVGSQTLNWTAAINAGDTAVISKLDSNARYAGTLLADGTTFNYADIDTARGAWHDGGKSPGNTNPNAGVGWKHDTDIGLFKSSVTQTVTLSIHSLLENGDADLTPDYGFTVFEGMDTSTGNYGHHGSWHEWDNQVAVGVGDNAYQITNPNPFTLGGGDGNGLEADQLILDDVNGNSATFLAEAGKVYTIFLGGFQGGGWTFTRNDYELTISAAPVPLPGAAWLFGSAIGLLGWRRRNL